MPLGRVGSLSGLRISLVVEAGVIISSGCEQPHIMMIKTADKPKNNKRL